MADVALDPKPFRKRLKLLYDSWKVREGWWGCDNFGGRAIGGGKPVAVPHAAPHAFDLTCCCCCCCAPPQANKSSLWENAGALGIMVGGTSEDLRYLKSISLHLWLFGYELPGGWVGVQWQRLCRCCAAVSRVKPEQSALS